MLGLIVQIIAFFVALIGTFFKCVKEDSRGKPLHSSNGLPVLTTPGRYILSLLIASFLSSLWLSWDSARESSELRTNLKTSLAQQTTLGDQLTKTRIDLQNAQATNITEFKRVLDQQVQSGNDVAQRLQGTSDLLGRRIRSLSQVKSFGLILFFDDMSRPVPIQKRLGLSPGEERGLILEDSPGLLKDMLCSSHVEFEIRISSNPNLVFRAICVGDDFIPELVVPGSSIPLEVRYEQWDRLTRGMFVAFELDEETLLKIADDLGRANALKDINLNSFAAEKGAFATFRRNHNHSGGEDDFKPLEPFLPKYVGFSVAPNHGPLDPRSTWIYGAREHDERSPVMGFVFRNGVPIRVRPEWPGANLFH